MKRKLLLVLLSVLSVSVIIGLFVWLAPSDYSQLDKDIADRLNEHNQEPIEFEASDGSDAGFQGGFWVRTDNIHGNIVSTTVNYPQIDYCHGGINASTTELLDTYPMLEDIYWHTYDEQKKVDANTRVSIYMTSGNLDRTVDKGMEEMNKTEAVEDLRENGTVTCGTAFDPANIPQGDPVFN